MVHTWSNKIHGVGLASLNKHMYEVRTHTLTCANDNSQHNSKMDDYTYYFVSSLPKNHAPIIIPKHNLCSFVAHQKLIGPKEFHDFDNN